MKKLQLQQVIVVVFFLVAGLLVVLVLTMLRDDPQPASADYEIIIEQAIRTADPELCESIKESTKPGPTDAPIKITGQEAVDWCKEQVKAGHRILGG